MNEIRKDDWDGHWDRYADVASRNPAQHMRHELILEAMESISRPTERLLDVGSGQGDFLAKAVRAGAARSYAGFELSSSGIAISRKKLPQAEFVQIDLFAPPPEAVKFLNWASVAVCSDVLEHLDDPVGFLRALRIYVADKAFLIVTVPGGPMSAFDGHIGHRRHYSEPLIRQALRDAGFSVQGVMLAGFPFFNLYRLLVILRGRRLIADAESGESGATGGRLARIVMSLFHALFRFNLRSFPLGWQVVAVATKDGS